MIFLVMFEYFELRKPGQWWMKKGSSHRLKSPEDFHFKISQQLQVRLEKNSLESCSPLNPGQKHLHTSLHIFNCTSVYEFLEHYQLKKLPDSLSHILKRWLKDEVQILLLEKPPLPKELLFLQSEGQRVVTLSIEAIMNGVLVDGHRDSLEFLLHDLVHADLFFSHHHNEQVLFFKKISDHIKRFDPLIESDEKFETDLNAIMSDMNSTAEHLHSCLHSSLINHKKRQLSWPVDQNLPFDSEAELKTHFAPFFENRVI